MTLRRPLRNTDGTFRVRALRRNPLHGSDRWDGGSQQHLAERRYRDALTRYQEAERRFRAAQRQSVTSREYERTELALNRALARLEVLDPWRRP